MPMGVVVAPMKNGEIISPDVFDTLSDDEKNEIMADLNAMQEEIAQHQDDAPGWEEKQTEEIKKLQEKLVKDAIKKPINDIKQKYRGNKKVAEYLKAVQNYILENIPSFVPNYDQDSKPQTEEEPMAGLLSQLKTSRKRTNTASLRSMSWLRTCRTAGRRLCFWIIRRRGTWSARLSVFSSSAR